LGSRSETAGKFCYLESRSRNILHEISKLRANWIGHILCRNCLLQQVIEGKIKGGIEVTGRLGRRRRELLDDLNLLTTTIVAPPSNASKWQAGFNSAFKGMHEKPTNTQLFIQFINYVGATIHN